MKKHVLRLCRFEAAVSAAVMLALAGSAGSAAGGPQPQPMFNDAQLVSTSTTPPT